MPGGFHRLAEAAEMTGADRAAPEQRPQFELDAGRERERAFGADQEMRKVRRIGEQRIEVVAADPSLHFRESRLDLGRLAGAEREQIFREIAQSRRDVGEIRRDRAEMCGNAVGEHRVDREHVVAHGAVTQRAGAAGIVGRHAADRRARGGGNIDREPQPVGFQRAVEVVEHDAGLDRAAPPGDVELEHAVEVARAVDHQRLIDRLPALRGAAAAREHAHPLGAGDRDRALGLGNRLRQHDAERQHLVMRGVGRVAAAAEGVEEHAAADLGGEPPFEAGHEPGHHGPGPIAAKMSGKHLRPIGLTEVCIRP